MRRARPGRARRGCAAAALLGALALPALAAGASREAPASPYGLLASPLKTPPLDPLPLCIAPDLSPHLAELAQRAVAGALGDALGALQADLEGTTPAAPEQTLLVATLRARAAGDRAARHEARRGLEIALSRGETAPPGVRVCARLEAARLDLLLGRRPEAAAQAALALRDAGTPPPAAIAEAAGFLRAEALYLAGWRADAQALHETLAASSNGSLAAAARLRLADLRFDADPASARRDYDAVLDPVASAGSVWALRAAEAALAEHDAAAARAWIERFLRRAPSREAAALARIRLADCHALENEPTPSLGMLAAVAEEQEGTPIGTLARLRGLELRRDRQPGAEALEFLRASLGAEQPGLAAYAAALLGRALAEAGALDEAIEVVSRLAAGRGADALGELVGDAFDRALAAASRDAGSDAECGRLVRRMGGRIALLLSHARAPEPFLRLADCYTQLGLARSALEVQRDVARSFGQRSTPDFALRVARTALIARELALARRVAEAEAGVLGAPSAEWSLLLGEVELAEGRWAEAAARLAERVREGRPAAARVRGLLALARAASHLAPAEPWRDTLDDALFRLGGAEIEAAPAAVGEAALLVGDLQRRAGDAARAERAYALALERLPGGAQRAEAGYWLALLTRDPVGGTLALQQAAQTRGGGDWARLAANELQIERLRAELGGGAAAETQP